MSKIPVTVLMPVYDPPPEMLEQAVRSVLAQTFSDFELLILDDGSPAEAVRAQLDFWAASDSRVRLQHEPHRGVPETLNRGLQVARGAYIARQDSDDWSEPDRLARQFAFLEQHPGVALVGTDTYSHCADGTPLWRLRLPHTPAELARAMWRRNPFVHGSTMYRRRTALAVGGYRRQLSGSADYDFLWRVTETGSAVNLDEVLYHYRYSGGSISVRRASDQVRAYRMARLLAAARTTGEAEDIPAALAKTMEDAPAHALRAALKQADHFMLAGDFRGAREAYFHQVLVHPRNGLVWAKMLRLAVFAAVPPVRQMCFR